MNKSDTQRKAMQKAKAMANKLNEPTYVLTDSKGGYFGVDELTTIIDMRGRTKVKTIKPDEQE